MNILNTTDSIEKIVRQAAKNNRLAQRELYNRFHGQMLGLCIRMTESRNVGEDIVQEGFIKAFLKLKQLKQPEKFGAWLKRIIVNECINYIKTVRYHETLEHDALSDEEDNSDWFKSISFEEINTEIDRLPKGCKQIFTLYLMEDYKHREIAELLDISVSTVKSQYQYALKILQNKLKVRMI